MGTLSSWIGGTNAEAASRSRGVARTPREPDPGEEEFGACVYATAAAPCASAPGLRIAIGIAIGLIEGRDDKRASRRVEIFFSAKRRGLRVGVIMGRTHPRGDDDMARFLIPAALLALAGAAALAVFPLESSGAVPKFRYRLQSGAMPHEDDDVLKVILTNTTDKPATAVVVVHKLGAQHQLDASPLAQSVAMTPRQEASVTKALDPGTFDIAEHAVEVLTSSPNVIVTTQLLRGGAEVPGRNLTNADFLRTKGAFADPTK
jgi:hypothetical protein